MKKETTLCESVSCICYFMGLFKSRIVICVFTLNKWKVFFLLYELQAGEHTAYLYDFNGSLAYKPFAGCGKSCACENLRFLSAQSFMYILCWDVMLGIGSIGSLNLRN